MEVNSVRHLQRRKNDTIEVDGLEQININKPKNSKKKKKR
jgi:hypothetical protein